MKIEYQIFEMMPSNENWDCSIVLKYINYFESEEDAINSITNMLSHPSNRKPLTIIKTYLQS